MKANEIPEQAEFCLPTTVDKSSFQGIKLPEKDKWKRHKKIVTIYRKAANYHRDHGY